MPLQSSGQISLDDLHVEVGGTSGTECSMNDSDIRGLIGLSSASQAAMNAFYGASSGQFLLVKNNGSGSYSQLSRVSGSTIYTEAGYIGSSNIYQNTGYNPPLMSANQGSLSPTSFPGGHTITGIILYGNPGGVQIQIYVSGGGTTNTGFTTLTIRERGDANKNFLIDTGDMFVVKDIMSGSGIYSCFADCNNNNIIDTGDMFCIKDKI